MFSNAIISFMSGNVLTFAIGALVPLMAVTFILGITFRWLIYFTVKRHDWFAREFEKRVHRFIESEDADKPGEYSFYMLTKKILERTYYESFEVRDRLKRRRGDGIMSMNDRVFLVKQGTAWLVKDILKQIKFLKWNDQNPKLLNITKTTFNQNPCFNRVFGLISISRTHDVIQILPSLFVIGGIFGTFLGIVKGLPQLGQMDLANMEVTKQIMDQFLYEISFAMNSSIIGIFFSVVMTFFNTLFSPDRVFVEMVDRFEASLDLLWYRSNNNHYNPQGGKFDEHRDPLEALAEESVKTAVKGSVRMRDLDDTRKAKSS
jgi:hypothetical protein